MSTDTLRSTAALPAVTSRHWLTAGLAFIGLAFGYTSMAFLTLGVFMRPLGQEFGWNRGEVASALSIGAIVLIFTTPIAGRLIDRIGVRKVLLPSMAAMGFALMGMYFISGNLWGFYAMFALGAVVSTAANNVSYIRLLSAWFVEKRGLVIGIASAGTAAGQALGAYIAATLIQAHGWRVAYLGLGFTVLVVGLPILTLLLRDTPEEVGLQPYGKRPGSAAAALTGVTKSEALRMPVFWTLVIVAFCMAIAMNGAQIHFVPMLIDKGIPPAHAAGAFVMLMSVGIVIGRLGTGLLFDRFFAPRVAMVVFALPVIALFLAMHETNLTTFYVVAVLLGLGLGSESDILGYLTSRYFGLKSMGELYGYIFGAFMAGSAAGPAVYGFVQSATGSYDYVIGGSAAVLVAMILVFALMPRFKDSVAGGGH